MDGMRRRCGVERKETKRIIAKRKEKIKINKLRQASTTMVEIEIIVSGGYSEQWGIASE